jgi:VanZ family protein
MATAAESFLPVILLLKMPPRSRLLRWIPVLIWMAVIFMNSTDAMSSAHTSRFIEPFLRWLFPAISPQAVDTIHLCIRKFAHVFEYGVLALLLWLALPDKRRNPDSADWRRASLALLIASLYGATDEFHQIFVPSRGASIHDVLIDASGAAVTLLIIALACRRNPHPAPAIQ